MPDERQVHIVRERPDRRVVGVQAACDTEAQRGYDEARESGDRRLEARGERMIGLALAAQGKHSAAIPRLTAGASLARKIGEGYEEALALLALARAREALGRSPAAPRRRAEEILGRMGAVAA